MTFTMAVGVFFICSLVNVMLSTCKTVLTVKAKKGTATLINACTYGFYAIVVKQLASFDLIYTVTITIITNIIGVYASLWILEKFSKDKLWLVKITISADKFEKAKEVLKEKEIPFTYYDLEKYYVLDCFCSTQKQTEVAKKVCIENNGKIFATESKIML